jgi:hypothetical protein
VPCPISSEQTSTGACPKVRGDLVVNEVSDWSEVVSHELPEEAIVSVLMKHHYKLHTNFPFFYISPNIPRDKINQATTLFSLPPAERIIGYVETSRATQSRTVVVFGSTSIFFKDTGYVSPFRERWFLGRIEPSSGRIPYHDFVRRQFRAEPLHIGVSLDEGQYLSIVDHLHRTIFVELLNSLKETATANLA